MNTTVTTSCDGNYFWGAFLLASSMRLNRMEEPVLVLGRDFSPRQQTMLRRIPGVRFIDNTSVSRRSLTCSKPIIMRMAETPYVMWADCDGFFVGNCSSRLAPPEPGRIHIRMRTPADNAIVFQGRYDAGDAPCSVPQRVLEVWRRNIGDLPEPRCTTCGSACALCVATEKREFLDLWLAEMERRIENEDVGVTDFRSAAYFQLDESVLNSVLFFSSTAPTPTAEWQLHNDPAHYYVHFANRPKPWESWSRATWKHYDHYLAVVQFALDQKWVDSPEELPFSLRPGYRSFWAVMHAPAELYLRARRKLRQQLHR